MSTMTARDYSRSDIAITSYLRDVQRLNLAHRRGRERLSDFHELMENLDLDQQRVFARMLLVRIMSDVPDVTWQSALDDTKTDHGLA